MAEIRLDARQVLVALSLWQIGSFAVLLFMPRALGLFVWADQDIFSTGVGLVTGPVGAGIVLAGGAGDDDESTLGIVLVHGYQNGLLVDFAAVLGLLVRSARRDAALILLGERLFFVLDGRGRRPSAARRRLHGLSRSAILRTGRFVWPAVRLVTGSQTRQLRIPLAKRRVNWRQTHGSRLHERHVLHDPVRKSDSISCFSTMLD